MPIFKGSWTVALDSVIWVLLSTFICQIRRSKIYFFWEVLHWNDMYTIFLVMANLKLLINKTTVI